MTVTVHCWHQKHLLRPITSNLIYIAWIHSKYYRSTVAITMKTASMIQISSLRYADLYDQSL